MRLEGPTRNRCKTSQGSKSSFCQSDYELFKYRSSFLTHRIRLKLHKLKAMNPEVVINSYIISLKTWWDLYYICQLIQMWIH